MIQAMHIIEKHPHPNADALWIYHCDAPGTDRVQVVANADNVYEVGDVAAVALAGARLDDGTRITRAILRGVPSHGMLLGRVDDAVGTDLTARLGSTELGLTKWGSIEGLHNLVVTMRKHAEAAEQDGLTFSLPTVRFRGKIKLDGTNAAVLVAPDGRVAAQSRTRLLTPGDDNYGFAAWLAEHEAAFGACAGERVRVFYGEWCGPGVQKRAAIARVDRKVFCLFAVLDGATMVVEPDAIAALAPALDDVFVLPWDAGAPVTLDFADRESLERAADAINARIEDVETEDPWVKSTFGVSGVGEGLVYYPLAEDVPEVFSLSNLLFKAKGDKHKVTRQAKSAQVDPEVSATIDEFVELFATDARLEQALETVFGTSVPTVKGTGRFLKAFSMDVQKESAAELEASGLTWKQVQRAVGHRARDWFMQRVQTL